MADGTFGALLRAAFARTVEAPLDEAMQASLSTLASDPVLASAVRRIGDGGDTGDPRIEEMAQRVVAAGS